MGNYHTDQADKDDEIARLRAELADTKDDYMRRHKDAVDLFERNFALKDELADMREIAENWEIKAKQTDIKLLLGVDRQDGETDPALWQRTETALRKIIYAELAAARQDAERMQAAVEEWRAAREAFWKVPPVSQDPKERFPVEIWTRLGHAEHRLMEVARAALHGANAATKPTWADEPDIKPYAASYRAGHRDEHATAEEELAAARQDVERMREAILSMIPSLDRLITDYQCVPDASDGDGQSVFDDARTALAKARAALQGATGTPKPEK